MSGLTALLLLSCGIAMVSSAENVVKQPSAKSAIDDMTFKHLMKITGKEDLKEFIDPGSVHVVFFFKKANPEVRSFLKLLEKSADYLHLYDVQVGLFDCNSEEGRLVEECDKSKVDKFIYTYKLGRELLPLELETMFDVNSIMSNILQLVLLREVPIIQTPGEVTKYLSKRRGRVNVIFGYMRAIGTQEHRIFMEVAYAYQNKFNFCVCTDRKATVNFVDPPNGRQKSSIWLIQTKDMTDMDRQYNNIRFLEKLSLASFAKFTKAVSLPKVFYIPKDGLVPPYEAAGLNVITFYYKTADQERIMSLADLVHRHCQGNFGIVSIDVETHQDGAEENSYGRLPTMSLNYHDENFPKFVGGPLTADSIVSFIDSIMNDPGRQRKIEETEDTEETEEEEELNEDEGDLPVNVDEVETEDDVVAHVVHLTRKIPMKLDRVTPLTDKTFPTTIKGTPTVLVMFYFPFSAVSMAFLRIVGESVEAVGDSVVKVTRVSCYDWTDVCAAQNITNYPTLRIFQGGKTLRDYSGAMDIQAVIATVKLLEMSMPLTLKTMTECEEFISGVMPPDLSSITNVTALGIFDKHHTQERKVFESVARLGKQIVLYGVCDSADLKQLEARFDTTAPAVVLTKLEDSIEPHVVFDTEDFTPETIEMFVKDNKLPKLTELTSIKFPDLYNKGHPFVILFTDWSDDSMEAEESLRQIIKAGHHNNITFSLMSVPNLTSLGFTVLNTYSPDPVIPTISFVNLQQGQVFNFEGESYQSSDVGGWLASVTMGQIPPSNMLSEGEWKPMNKGYNFLELERLERKLEREKAVKEKGGKEEEREEREERHSTDTMSDIDGAGTEGETRRPHSSEKVQNEEILSFQQESDTRQELLELHNSRLYHHHHHHGDRDKVGQKQKKDGEKEGNNEQTNNKEKKTMHAKHDEF